MKFNRRDFIKLMAGTTGLILLNTPKQASASNSPNISVKAVLVDTTKCVGCWWCYAACKLGSRCTLRSLAGTNSYR
jgi:succinate dehydrogenase/fumarate reductase-like Fe-S protein